MNQEIVIEKLFNLLVSGERDAARTIANQVLESGVSHEELTKTIYWPLLEMVDTMYRSDQMTTLAHRYASKLLRTLVDQAQLGYERMEARDRKILVFCGPSEGDELSAQLVADLAEADGYEVLFAGGGIANDEILAEVGQHDPDILLMFAAAPSDCPEIRQLFDTIREIGACPETQLVVGGGVFNRAPGLAEEIGADLWATSPSELLDVLSTNPERRATEEQRTVGRSRRKAA